MDSFKPKKSLGQNFLNDKNILRKITDSILIDNEDDIIEIGPGTGALTEYILKKKPKSLTSIDLDSRSIDLLKKKFHFSKFPELTLLHSDIREIDLNKLMNPFGNEKFKIKIAGNIPYNISADIFFWIFKQRTIVEFAVLMIQKEVAQRLSAKVRTKSYGILTVVMDLIGSCEILFDVSPSCFYPKPKVTSTVIKLVFNKSLNCNFEDIVQFIKAAFSQRRKVLRNSLKTYLETNKILTGQVLDNDVVIKKGFFNKRAEELTSYDFIELFTIINELKQL